MALTIGTRTNRTVKQTDGLADRFRATGRRSSGGHAMVALRAGRRNRDAAANGRGDGRIGQATDGPGVRAAVFVVASKASRRAAVHDAFALTWRRIDAERARFEDRAALDSGSAAGGGSRRRFWL